MAKTKNVRVTDYFRHLSDHILAYVELFRDLAGVLLTLNSIGVPHRYNNEAHFASFFLSTRARHFFGIRCYPDPTSV
jgi:hypothetical protein